jgi:hypothetical protein
LSPTKQNLGLLRIYFDHKMTDTVSVFCFSLWNPKVNRNTCYYLRYFMIPCLQDKSLYDSFLLILLFSYVLWKRQRNMVLIIFSSLTLRMKLSRKRTCIHRRLSKTGNWTFYLVVRTMTVKANFSSICN